MYRLILILIEWTIQCPRRLKMTIYKDFPLENETEARRLYRLGFKDCANTISLKDTEEKAQIASEIQTILDSLYTYVQKYGTEGCFAKDKMEPATFAFVLKKIERWETVLYWIYEVDMLMGETEIDRLIRKAERLFQAGGADAALVRFKIEEVVVREEGGGLKIKKQRVPVNIAEELQELRATKESKGRHTEDIVAMAANLTKKFYMKK